MRKPADHAADLALKAAAAADRIGALRAMVALSSAYLDRDDGDIAAEIPKLREALALAMGLRAVRAGVLSGRRTSFGAGEHRAFRLLAWDAAEHLLRESDFEKQARWARIVDEALGVSPDHEFELAR